MYAVERLGSYISRGVYTVSGPFHPFGGAVDIIVVQQEDGSFKSSAWNVRFGKFQGVLKSKEKVVRICVNGEEADFHMYLDNKGEAYFLREADAQEGESELCPSSSSGDETDEQSRANRQPLETQSCSYDVESLIVDPADKVLSRNNSRKSRIFGIFGSRLMKERQTVIDEGEGGDDTVGRVDSLERAEFAANLLEVKWSTSLATKKPRKGGGSRFSCPDLLESAVDEDLQTSFEHRRVTSSLPDCALETTFCNDKKGNDYLSGLNEPHSYAEEAALISCLKSPDIVSRVCRELSETGATENDGNVVAVISNITGSDSPNPQSVEVESFPGKHFVGQVFDDKGVLAGCGISQKAGGIDRVESFIYCESSESSVGGTDGASEQTHEKLYIARGGSGQVHVRAEAVHARTALSKDTVTGQLVGDISLKMQPVEVPKDSCNETADYNHNVDLKEPIKAPEDYSQMVHISALPGSVEGNESPILSGSSNSDHKVHDEKDFKDQNNTCDVQTSSGYFSGSEMTETTSVVQPGRLEEEQFLFSDSDELNITKVQRMESSSSLRVEGESSLLSSPDGSKELNGAVAGTNYHSDSSPEKFAQEKASTGCEKCVGTIRTTSTIDIPRNHKAAEKEVGRLAESLPNMWLQTDNLSPLDLQTDEQSALDLHSPLSHSLDSKDRTLKWIHHSKDDLSCIELSKEQQLPQVELDTESAQGTPEFKDVPGSPAFGDPSKVSITSSGSWKLWPFAFRRTNSQKAMQPNLNDSKSPDVEDASDSTFTMESSNTVLTPKGMKKTERSTSPTSEQLASLNLKEGKNTVTFTFSTAMLGKQQVEARIYLWKWNTRIVISDVDGTITKSDVLGQFMPLVGVDWSQTGVTHLFSAIKENGYELLFLSARAISQSSRTRQFLFNLKQDGKALPDGPVVISPDGLFPSLFREVIRRAPHEFKIACLEDIKSLFPSDCKPFYAGFGNRDTDEFSYLKVGIPLGKIFIINPKGEVVVNRRVDSKSYTSLHALVNGMFPATTSSNVQEDFNSWNYWKLPLPDV